MTHMKPGSVKQSECRTGCTRCSVYTPIFLTIDPLLGLGLLIIIKPKLLAALNPALTGDRKIIVP